MKRPPLPPAVPGRLPVIGHLRQFGKNRVEFFTDAYKRCGPIFTIGMGPMNAVVLIGPPLHEIFFTKTDTALSMGKAYKFLGAMFGEIAFVASPAAYANERHILQAPVQSRRMDGHYKVMLEETAAWIDSLGESGEFEIVAEMQTLAQRISSHAFMGRSFRNAMGSEFWDNFGVLARALDPILPPWLPIPKFIRRDRAKARIHAMIQPIINERRANPGSHDDFLQDFVEARYKDGGPLPDDKIIGFILAMTFAGYETTSGQAAWALLEILKRPEHLARVRAEADAWAANPAPPTIKDVAAFEHLERCVHESNRMKPVTDLILRVTNEEMEIDGFRIPKGWLVIASPPVAQRLPEWFSEPDEYKPERFAPGAEEHKKHRFSIITFGGGAHRCTGMNFAILEMQVIVGMIVNRLNLEIAGPYPEPCYGAGVSHPHPTRIRYSRRAR